MVNRAVRWPKVLSGFGMCLLIAAGLFWLSRLHHEQVFKPAARDEQLVRQLFAAKFGSDLQTVEVPLVNRDIGVIYAWVGIRPKLLQEFERTAIRRTEVGAGVVEFELYDSTKRRWLCLMKLNDHTVCFAGLVPATQSRHVALMEDSFGRVHSDLARKKKL